MSTTQPISAATDAGAVLEALGAAIDGLLALNAECFAGDDELHAFVVRSQRERHRLAAALAPVLNRWDRLGVWAVDGSRSAAARLSRDANTSKPAAARELARARKLQVMPITAAALAGGTVSPEHVDLLANANRPHRNTLFARDEAMLVGMCATMRWQDSAHAVGHWENLADATTDTPEPAGAKRADRASLHASKTLGGMVAVNGTLDPIGGEVFTNELNRLERILYLADKESGIERTPAQRRAAALVEMATRSSSTPEGSRRPKPLFVAHVGDETARHLCALAGGTIVKPSELVDWANDALLETFLFDGPRVVLTGSPQRTFNGVLRRAIEARDRHCQHPAGCDVPTTRADIDHIVPWSRGGPTDQFNGRVQCPTHNRNHRRHDHGAEPLARQPVDLLAALRAKCRWVHRRALEHDGDPPA